MKKSKRQFIKDLILLTISIVFAVYLAKAGIAERFVTSLDGLSWFGVIIAGMFFTSFFTTAPSIVLLGTLAQTTPLPVLVIFGALGAVFGDYIIFRFVKTHFAADAKYLMSLSHIHRFPAIFKTRLFKFFVPFIGALIIASPLPDELGVGLLGLSKVKTRTFFLLSYIFNGAGILAIGLVAKAIIGL